MKKQKKITTGIYKIESPTGKVYIGQSINIEKRWGTYLCLNCKNQIKLFNSLKKYGSENHVFEIIEECLEEQLLKKETYWKEYYLEQLGWKYMLFCELYDMGSKGPRSEETKQKIGLANKGKKRTQEHILNLKKGKKNISQETRNKISKAKKGKPLWEDGRSHSQYYTQEIKDKISKGNKGKLIKKESIDKINYGKSKPILQYDLEGNFIKEWSSIKEAAINLGLKNCEIVSNLKNRQKRTKTHKFKYKYENGNTNHQEDKKL